MIDFSNINTISFNDSKRLKDSFFRSPKNRKNKHHKRNKIILITGSILAVVLVWAFIALNFNIVIFPRYKDIYNQKLINFLDNKYISSVRFINPHLGSKITKKVILIEIPFNTKSGISIALKDKTDLSNSELILVVKRPEYDFKLLTILRDTSFFSNAGKPIEIDTSLTNNKAPYAEIPIDIDSGVGKNVSIKRINQLRFVFYQKKVGSLPLLIKGVYLKRRQYDDYISRQPERRLWKNNDSG